MSATNPYVYSQDESLHGEYMYLPLVEVVDNFLQGYTGDNTKLGKVKRFQVLLWAKKGLQQLTFDVLREFKAIEQQLGETLDITLPNDYVNYVRISWLDEVTGNFRPMAQNNRITNVQAYLQDHNSEILFDNNGYILEGTSYTGLINDSLTRRNYDVSCCNCGGYEDGCCNDRTLWSLDTSKNYNGDFIVKNGKIHFSSNCLSKAIILEYISDGLQSNSEADIKVHKFAEMALYAWIKHNLLANREGVSVYEKESAKKDWFREFRNAKVRLGNFHVAEVQQLLQGGKKWMR